MPLTSISVLNQFKLISKTYSVDDMSPMNRYYLRNSLLLGRMQQDFINEIRSVLKGKNVYIGTALIGTIKDIQLDYYDTLWCIIKETDRFTRIQLRSLTI